MPPETKRKQAALLELISSGVAPRISMKEAVAATGYSTHGSLLRAIEALERRGLVTRDRYRRWRSLAPTEGALTP